MHVLGGGGGGIVHAAVYKQLIVSQLARKFPINVHIQQRNRPHLHNLLLCKFIKSLSYVSHSESSEFKSETKTGYRDRFFAVSSVSRGKPLEVGYHSFLALLSNYTLAIILPFNAAYKAGVN
jgi:hypothetical protein